MNEPETQIGLSSLVVKAFGISDTAGCARRTRMK